MVTPFSEMDNTGDGKGSLAKMRSSAWGMLSLRYVGESKRRGPVGSRRKVGGGESDRVSSAQRAVVSGVWNEAAPEE